MPGSAENGVACGRHAPADAPSAQAPQPAVRRAAAATPIERVHLILRTMADADWSALRARLAEAPTLTGDRCDTDLDLVERLFRRGDASAGEAGGAVLRVVRAILDDAVALRGLQEAQEKLRTRIRFVLREMSGAQWEALKAALEQDLPSVPPREDIAVLELVFRIGESVSNVETAACAKSDRAAGRVALHPDVARRNAIARAAVPGAAAVDVEAVYRAAKREHEKAEATARRAASTLASLYVETSSPYRHARNTVFRLVDAIVEAPALLARVAAIEAELRAVPALSREELRWALHRMPPSDRVALLRFIPLNTILMFLPGEPAGKPEAIAERATRDRRLAYGHFVEGRSEGELAAIHRLTVNGVKNALGALLEGLLERPLARRAAQEYLARTKVVEGMGLDEARRRLKQLTPEQRAELLSRIPSCAWRAPDRVVHLHKQLVLDYLSGEWVLGRLVHHYNLDPNKRVAGTFRVDGSLTIRGANAAITGVLQKITEEPDVRACLRQWTGTPGQSGQEARPERADPDDAALDGLLPWPPPHLTDPAGTGGSGWMPGQWQHAAPLGAVRSGLR
jgi:hypothetical protein